MWGGGMSSWEFAELSRGADFSRVTPGARFTAAEPAPSGPQMLAASTDNSVRLWDLETGANRVLLQHGTCVRALHMFVGGDGRPTLAVGDASGEIWLAPYTSEPTSTRLVGSFKTPIAEIRSVRTGDDVVLATLNVDGVLSLRSTLRDAVMPLGELYSQSITAIWAASESELPLLLVARGGSVAYLSLARSQPDTDRFALGTAEVTSLCSFLHRGALWAASPAARDGGLTCWRCFREEEESSSQDETVRLWLAWRGSQTPRFLCWRH